MNKPNLLIPLVAEDIATSQEQEINNSRRSAIKQLALACGLVLSSSSLSALAASVTPPTDLSRSKKTLLNSDQLALVRELGEIIIPTTDTPGAIAAGVHDFINHFIAYCATPAEQQELFAGLKTIDTAAQSRVKKSFLSANKTEQIELLTSMEKAADGFTQNDRHFIKQLKALVTFGYYTSEIGATQELAYLAIPGGYKGNFKFKDVGKAWALPQ
ncbi:gluconate 2-dehydrogenase subunit 3 family protein [Cellvibrio sp. NN19]|uniref:gluconate 2-dehydrogenase subunit 3 family protein n=1 Tax=Cellvibrio chitinivorans TaxID=3102792 RepID=UPI002B40F600|nr:gluconate 2-dehydrogenase subunit 3 family protein [Cellvibrio sp. NN19]